MAGVGIVTMVAWAGIPEPDAILYGCVNLTGVRQTTADNVTVFATLGAATDPKVGSYKLGDNPAAGDRYVLRIKLETPVEGSPLSSDAASIGQTARIFAQKGGNPPQELARFRVRDRGVIDRLSLPRGNFEQDADIDLKDFSHFQACFSGTGRSPSAGCADADLDDDGDVDLVDYAYFKPVLTGPTQPVTCD
jgi:hypothetical protein